MPDLDDHMDELFQKAAANYPLKTKPGNFDDLLPFVAGETASTTAPAAKKGKRRLTLLLLAFLVTGGSIVTYFISNNNSGDLPNNNKSFARNPLTEKSGNKTTAQINIVTADLDKPVTAAENILSEQENSFQKNKKSSYNKARLLASITQSVPVADDVNTEKEQVGNGKTQTEKNVTPFTNPKQLGNADVTTEIKKEIAAKPAQKQDLQKKEAKPAASDDKKKKNKPSLYYGLAVGAELNQVKNQGMTRAGFNGGLVLGLQISKKLSVETGVQVSQKKYYSAGKHFNPKTGIMPSNMTIMSLDGTSTLVEIPLSVKYDFGKKNNTFYGKAGVSSYLMTKESNRYQAIVSGQDQEINGTYKNAHCYPVSELRISAGYQHSLGKKLRFRVEPYVQIPLKGRYWHRRFAGNKYRIAAYTHP